MTARFISQIQSLDGALILLRHAPERREAHAALRTRMCNRRGTVTLSAVRTCVRRQCSLFGLFWPGLVPKWGRNSVELGRLSPLSSLAKVNVTVPFARARTLAWTKPATSGQALGTLADLARSKPELVAENALLRQQLIVLRWSVKRPKVTRTDRVLIVLLATGCVPGGRHSSSSNPTPSSAGTERGSGSSGAPSPRF